MDEQILETLLVFIKRKEAKESTICRFTSIKWIYEFLSFFKIDIEKENAFPSQCKLLHKKIK
jgi:hypothetical protein